jgi:hypothetical protein
MSCRKCGKDVSGSICVDCFAEEVRESRRRSAEEIVSEMTGIIVAHLETMPESERKERMAAFRDEIVLQKPHIRENRFGGDLIELGAIHALFEDMPMSEVGVTSGAQSAFTAAHEFIHAIVQNQCELAGCLLSKNPYGYGDVHTEKCWFTKRAMLYRDRASNSHG